MKHRILLICSKILLVALAVCLTVLLIEGCAVSPQPTVHPIAGTSIMLVPKGTKIGNQVAPEDGIYIGKSRIAVPKEEGSEIQKKRYLTN